MCNGQTDLVYIPSFIISFLNIYFVNKLFIIACSYSSCLVLFFCYPSSSSSSSLTKYNEILLRDDGTRCDKLWYVFRQIENSFFFNLFFDGDISSCGSLHRSSTSFSAIATIIYKHTIVAQLRLLSTNSSRIVFVVSRVVYSVFSSFICTKNNKQHGCSRSI